MNIQNTYLTSEMCIQNLKLEIKITFQIVISGDRENGFRIHASVSIYPNIASRISQLKNDKNEHA